MYRLTRTSAAAPIPLDTLPTVSYPRAEVEETETKVRPVSTEKENTHRLDVGEGSMPTCKPHPMCCDRQAKPARRGQQAPWRWSKGQQWNPVTLGKPGDSWNYICWGCRAFRSHWVSLCADGVNESRERKALSKAKAT